MSVEGATIYPVMPPACALGWVPVRHPEEIRRGGLGTNGVCTSGVTVGFLPSWWHANYGLDFGEDWHRDPRVRKESFDVMQRALHERFGDLGLGHPRPEELPGTIDFLYGIAFVPALFGARIRYCPDGFPKPLCEPMTDGEIEKLEVPDIEGAPIWRELMSQIDYLETHHGGCTGRVNVQGILNLAFQLRGQQIMVDLLANPALCRRLFGVLRETMVRVIRLLDARMSRNPTEEYFVPSNCTVNMISGEVYREFLLPRDREMSRAFGMFGIHNCGWSVDTYVPHYAAIGNVRYLDSGMESDLEEVRRRFQRAMLSVIYPPERLRKLAPADLRRDAVSILERLGRPSNIILADIEAGTGDDAIRAVHEASLGFRISDFGFQIEERIRNLKSEI